VRLSDIIKAIEHWAGRARTWAFVFGLVIAVPTALTVAFGYLGGNFGQTSLAQLIPAALLTAAASAWLGRGFLARARNTSSARGIKKDTLTCVTNFHFYCDHTKQYTTISFTPTKTMSRLRIRLDYSQFLEGLIGIGSMWSMPKGIVIADLHDVTSGVHQNEPLTGTIERKNGDVTQYFLKWATEGEGDVLHPSAICRCRLAFIPDDEAEEYYVFVGHTYVDADTKRIALKIINQEQLYTINYWQSGIITRGLNLSS
jgi:hypothetical protein